MAYRFNGGLGAVTCDICNTMIDADLSYDEYKNEWSSGHDDLCIDCFNDLALSDKKTPLQDGRLSRRLKRKAAHRESVLKESSAEENNRTHS